MVEPDLIEIPEVSISAHNNYNVSCFDSGDGFIHLDSIFGGHYYAPYNFNWELISGSGSVQENSQNQDDLDGGVYKVTITDEQGCFSSDTFTLTKPSRININYTTSIAPDGIHHIRCFEGSEGFINLTITGGEAGYQYNWSNGSSLNSITNLQAGLYQVEVTDNISCKRDTTFELIEPPLLSISSAQISDFNGFGVSCANSSNGFISLNPLGGSGGYSYGWKRNGVSFSGNSNLQDLLPGIYTLRLTDVNGCIVDWSDTLKLPDELNLKIIATNINCTGDELGTALAEFSGGVGEYVYQWNTGATSPLITGLDVGNYIFSITDENNCQKIDTAIIKQDTKLWITMNILDSISCNGSEDGVIQAQCDSGYTPYTFVWEGNGIAQNLSNVKKGFYSVHVTDARGCQGEKEFFVDDPDSVLLLAEIKDASCFGFSDGEVTLQGTGGYGNYVYTYDNDPVIGNVVSGLIAGKHNFGVYDSKNCSYFTSFDVNEPEPLEFDTINSFRPLCPDWSNGRLEVIVKG
ncbi:MAG: hypothetical protein HC906_14085, partial [Bacteroidales bacterium]|nr:hypothetical protein [Bacteroidales bacterium]